LFEFFTNLSDPSPELFELGVGRELYFDEGLPGLDVEAPQR